ncbi:MAG: DUF1214 domain-containing protein [Pseudomonadales bacterium]|jgi:hypothetical protein|nr:DUF1214 domain-containing protein [Pseudomonadales bacterium]MCP5337181.1 DUF1214 domain-containing protein [Pseudomonadales bacterium]
MSSPLLPWAEYVDLLKPAARLIDLTVDPHSEQLRAEQYRQFLMNLSLGYFLYFQSSPDHPDWAPFLNSVYLLQPNPDDTYLLAPVRGDATYRITGRRGTVKLLTLSVGANMMGMGDGPGKNFSYHDADDLTLGPNGEIDVILSTERPPGHSGDWLALHPEADFIMVRQRSYDWAGEEAGRLAIERVGGDPLKPRQDIATIDRQLRALLGGFTERLSRQWLNYQNDVIRRGVINRLEMTDIGGNIPVQVYWQGMFRLEPGQALILETVLPARQLYWNVQLNDEFWNAVEFVYRQSSLNGHQARLDSDGRFRAVIALEDPGVPNWLDPAGTMFGMLIGRWYAADSLPMPTLTPVPFAELRRHLPPDTPTVSPAERAEQLRLRRLGAQLRRRW